MLSGKFFLRWQSPRISLELSWAGGTPWIHQIHGIFRTKKKQKPASVPGYPHDPLDTPIIFWWFIDLCGNAKGMIWVVSGKNFPMIWRWETQQTLLLIMFRREKCGLSTSMLVYLRVFLQKIYIDMCLMLCCFLKSLDGLHVVLVVQFFQGDGSSTNSTSERVV